MPRTKGRRTAPAGGKTRIGPGQLRIIAGQYRGRRLPILEQPGLRPTSDRVRETLFNWLAPVIEGARCLDCFAGSGALGLEAASRGAGEVLMIERSEPVCRQLRENCTTLAASNIRVIRADALSMLRGPLHAVTDRAFDLVFLDPPFADELLESACDLLDQGGWISPGARIYLESPVRVPLPTLPAGWELIRERSAGQVRFALALVHG